MVENWVGWKDSWRVVTMVDSLVALKDKLLVHLTVELLVD
jgi:hypothetical protein